MRNLLIFLSAMLLAGAVAFVILSERRNAARLELELEQPAATAERIPRTSGEASPDTRRAESVPAEHESSPPAPTSLAGTVVVLDEQGGEHAAESGILALGCGVAGARTRHEVAVQGGRWSLPLPPGQAGERARTLSLDASVLGERVALPAPAQAAELAIPADGRMDLRLRWAATPRLHVRARDTGSELEEVLLYELPPALRGSPCDLLHPGPEARARAAGRSPVPLEPGENAGSAASRVFFAMSPGYAWGRIELDPGADAEPVLTLDPSGSLELVIQGEPAFTALEILLLGAEPPHTGVVDFPRGARSFLLDDLRPGHYLAEARDYGRLAGARKLEVVAGQRIQEVLEVARPSAPPVPFEGLLVLPEEYGQDEFLLEFLLQGRYDDGSLTKGSFEIRSTTMTREPGRPRHYRWSAPAALPARYRVQLFPVIPFVTEVDTGPSGTRDARIEVPPPAHVVLRCTDSETGAEIVGVEVSYHALGSRASRTLSGTGSPLEFQVPRGRVVITSAPGRYEPAARLVEVGPGRNELLLRLRRRP